MPEDTMLQEAMEALRQGERARARDLLTRLLRADQANPKYWLWMSASVDSIQEQIYCLQTVLKLDPENRAARQGLVLLGARPPEDGIQPVPPIRRKWDAGEQEVPRPGGLKGLWAQPAMRVLILSGGALLVLALICAGIFGLRFGRQLPVAFRATRTPGPPPTYTLTPTFVNYTAPAPTVTPTFIGIAPLWTLLNATYTPTPVYVSTPHTVNEAFRLAQREVEQGNLDAALQHLQQAAQMEPKAPDIPYLVGEILRRQGKVADALEAYKTALAIDPGFAPAYLGRARAHLAVNPEADVKDDLDQAIASDPNYGEALLERISYSLSKGDRQAASQDLKALEKILPDSPWLYLYQARIALENGEAPAALKNARQANDLDRTLLPTYLALGQAEILNQQYSQAVDTLKTYVAYDGQNASAWAGLGHAYFEIGQTDDALAALNQAIQLDNNTFDAYLYRGLANLTLDHNSQAALDLAYARALSPKSFMANLGLGRAWLAAGRLRDARDQLSACLDLAQTDEEKALVYYWRARTIETIGNPGAAAADWQALLALPASALLPGWSNEAQGHLDLLATITATVAAGRTASARTPTVKPPPTRLTAPPTGTRTVPASPSPKPSTARTPTPTATRKPAPTVTPTP